ncbi:MAG: glycosyltransferase family 2 protein [Eisenbergiella sp.]
MSREDIDVEVSIIVPVYNCKKYIEKCLDSVLNQTYHDIECIVVDDGSSDGSEEVIDRIGERDERVKVIHQKNSGVSSARNRALQLATGKYITFLDGDDYLGKGYIEQLVNAAEENSSELVICGYQMVDTNGRVLKKIIPGKYVAFEHEEWAYRISAVCGRLYRRDVWKRNHVNFEVGVRGEDVPISCFFNRVCRHIVTIQQAEYYYVQHKDSVTHNFRGLRNIKLPYQSINTLLERQREVMGGNSSEFLELGMMRFFAQCIFDLGRGAEKEQLRELCVFVQETMKNYFPGYWNNKLSSVWSNLEIPVTHKIAVKIFMILLKSRTLYFVARIL